MKILIRKCAHSQGLANWLFTWFNVLSRFQVPFWPHPICGRQLFRLAPTTHHALLFDPICRSIFNGCVKLHYLPLTVQWVKWPRQMGSTSRTSMHTHSK